MVAFRKAAAGTPLSACGRADWLFGADPNRIAFCRDTKGFVAINRTGSAMTGVRPTTLPDGRYCNVALHEYVPAGAGTPATCSGGFVAVTGSLALVTVSAYGAVALHVGAKL
jgi:alpha-amylase